MNILGISAWCHDAACCILKDGVLAAAAQEERFTRVRHDSSMPYYAMQYCLSRAGLTISDIDLMAYYEVPQKKLSRRLFCGLPRLTNETLRRILPDTVEKEMAEKLGYQGPVIYIPHQLAHAASSFFYSGFDESAIFTADGVGEWATTAYGAGSGKDIDLFEEVDYPHSIGLLYSTIANYLGFGPGGGEYQVMDLAPYGEPRYLDRFRQLLVSGSCGQYQLNMEYFDFTDQHFLFTDLLPDLFGRSQRPYDAAPDTFHRDVAKSLQSFVEELLLEKVNYLHAKTGMDRLCMAGSVALNYAANSYLLRNSLFKEIFIQPAANDAGGAIGAAAEAYTDITGRRPQAERLQHVYLGPSFSNEEIKKSLRGTFLKSRNFSGLPQQLTERVAAMLAEGKVIGWFQGGMEFGPRSLGARSILADPRHPGIRDRINYRIKKREHNRPLPPVVLEEKAQEHFDLDHASPFMLERCRVISPLHLPAVTQVDGTAHVQTVNDVNNPVLSALLHAFSQLTGCPILVNTSLNTAGEPIACSPADALMCFVKSDMDALVLGNYLFLRNENELDIIGRMLNSFEPQTKAAYSQEFYTFL